MKKYTNKILIVATALFLATLTVLVLYEVSNIKEQIKQHNIETNESVTNY